MKDAITAADQQRRHTIAEQDPQAEASWRERALTTEDALGAANREILQQRQRIADLTGHVRDLEQTWVGRAVTPATCNRCVPCSRNTRA
jgi:hypothetical protein